LLNCIFISRVTTKKLQKSDTILHVFCCAPFQKSWLCPIVCIIILTYLLSIFSTHTFLITFLLNFYFIGIIFIFRAHYLTHLWICNKFVVLEKWNYLFVYNVKIEISGTMLYAKRASKKIYFEKDQFVHATQFDPDDDSVGDSILNNNRSRKPVSRYYTI